MNMHMLKVNKPTKKVATEKVATKNTLTHKHKEAVPKQQTQTQTCSAHQAQESSHKKDPRQKQHKVQSNNGKEPQYIHYTDSYFVLDMFGV